MKFSLITLFALTLATACIMAVVVQSHWLLGSIEARNSEIKRQLQEKAWFTFRRGDVNHFASYLEDSHNIPTSLSPEIGSVMLESPYQHSPHKYSLRLKHLIQFALDSGDVPLTYFIRDGGLLIAPVSADDCIVGQYGLEDLEQVRMLEVFSHPASDNETTKNEGGVF